MAPAVTVAIPTRNRATLLRQALESLAAQTTNDFEVVVCDNASDDATPEVVREFAPMARLERSPIDIGFAANHLRALSSGDGRYVTILQDDDLVDPTSIERRIALLDGRPDASMAHTAFRIADIDLHVSEPAANWDGSPVDVVRDPADFFRRTFTDGRRSHLSASLYRRSAIDAATLDLRDAEVIELAVSLRCALHGPVAFLAEPLGTIRYHPQQNAVHSGVADADLAFERTFAQIALFRECADRFLRLFGDRLDDTEALRRGARRWVAFELRRQVLLRLPGGARPLAADALLRDAARVEPGILRDPRTLWILPHAVTGTRGRRRLASLRRRRAHPSPLVAASEGQRT